MDMIHTVLHYKLCAYFGDCTCISSKPSWSALIIETELLEETALAIEIIRYSFLPINKAKTVQVGYVVTRELESSGPYVMLVCLITHHDCYSIGWKHFCDTMM